jgi:hypothetical protein
MCNPSSPSFTVDNPKIGPEVDTSKMHIIIFKQLINTYLALTEELAELEAQKRDAVQVIVKGV